MLIMIRMLVLNANDAVSRYSVFPAECTFKELTPIIDRKVISLFYKQEKKGEHIFVIFSPLMILSLAVTASRFVAKIRQNVSDISIYF